MIYLRKLIKNGLEEQDVYSDKWDGLCPSLAFSILLTTYLVLNILLKKVFVAQVRAAARGLEPSRSTCKGLPHGASSLLPLLISTFLPMLSIQINEMCCSFQKNIFSLKVLLSDLGKF